MSESNKNNLILVKLNKIYKNLIIKLDQINKKSPN